MSPRNKAILCRFSLLACFLAVLVAAPPAAAGETRHDQARESNLLISLFQAHISSIDGDRCPMTPSCSEYARQVIQKHGPVLGWIMACDRLLRCGRDELALSPARTVNGRVHIVDPVAANDFWWFTPQADPLENPLEKQP